MNEIATHNSFPPNYLSSHSVVQSTFLHWHSTLNGDSNSRKNVRKSHKFLRFAATVSGEQLFSTTAPAIKYIQPINLLPDKYCHCGSVNICIF